MDEDLNLQRKREARFNQIASRKDERKEEAKKKIIENIVDFFESVAEFDDVFERAADIFKNIGTVVLRKFKEIKEQADIYQNVVNTELMVITESFFCELKKKTIKLQRVNPLLASNKKMIAAILWMTTIANPPASAGMILCTPLFYLIASQPIIAQKWKILTKKYNQFTKKPKKNNEQNFDNLMLLLNSIRGDLKHVDVFEVFEKEDIDMINEIELREIDQKRYERQKKILLDLDYEQKLYDYYSNWFSRRTASGFSLIITCTLLAWIAAKKINPKITNKTYRSYNNWYEYYRKKIIKSLLHSIVWLLKKIDQEEDINDLKIHKKSTE